MRVGLSSRERLLCTAAGGIAVLLASTGVASAQDASGVSEDIVVTGIRASLQNSEETKREQTSIVEVVSAEDIGSLPDVSIAESLARLPGLTAQRLNGRGQVLSVRGLAPDFTNALLNGREQVSTSDNRGVEFDQYPSELINQVVVYKTPDASLIGQGLAGTADMRTIRPLAFGRRAFAFNYRYEWNEYGALNSGTEDTGQRFSGSYVDQSADGRWGWAVGFAHLQSPSQGERFNAWGYPDTGGALVIGGAKPYVQSNELERTGVIGILEFAPSANFSTSLDVYYSEFEETQTLRGIELPLFWSSAVLQLGYSVTDGLVTSGAYTGVEGVVRNDLNQREATLLSVGWNTDLRLGDHWSAEFDLAVSRVERTDHLLETNSGTGYGVPGGAADTIGFTTGPNGTRFSPTLDYSNPGLILLTSPQGWGTDAAAGRPFGQAGYLNRPTVEDELRTLRISATRDFSGGVMSSIEFGVNISSREKSKRADEFFLTVAGGLAEAPIPAQYLLSPTDLTYLGLGPMVSYNPLALLNSGIFDTPANTNADVITKTWGVEEDVIVGYAQVNWNNDWLGMPFRGNVGLQAVFTDQSSNGYRASGVAPNTAIQAFTDGDDYVEILPSFNGSLELFDRAFLRLGLARTLSRARLDQMNASQTVNRDAGRLTSTDPYNSYWSSNGGNPRLRPWIADAFDLSFERYFSAGGYFSVAVFYKYLENYIFNQDTIVDFADFPANGAEVPATTLGRLTTPENGDGGEIRGLELTLSLPFEVIHDSLQGFGLIFSASFNESDIEPNGPGTGSSLPGLSEEVANLTLYYERYGFQARASARYRSEFLGEVSGFGNGRDHTFVEAETIIDAQIGYEFSGGPLRGLSILLQGQNLTDQEFVTFYNGDPRQVRDFQQYGATYMLGLNYKFN